MPFYNPSKIITDVLSKYLEFDPEELKLGIWNGNLSIQNVELKRDAMYPLLNSTAVANQDLKPPLNLKLVKGTVGQMRIRIPWKRLVWGQGDVKLQVSDVTIAVAYESREETAARKLPKNQETTAQIEEEKTEESEEENKRKRDLKQEWLREAERCQLQGRPFPTKTDIAENAAEETNNTDRQPSGAARRGRVDTWLKNTTQSFAWRFMAGLQASIRNVRVVIVQDGVEIGTIFHAMDIIPKSLNTMANPVEGNQEDTEASGDTPADASMATPPPDVVPQGEYEDGEHLDKIVKLQSFGIFVRREDKKSKSPMTLRFSTSVAADDYVLRPTDGSLAISIFDPYPPGKQTKKKAPTIEEEPTTPTTATATATVDSVSSSKSRRSKRDKRPLLTDDKPVETPTGSDAVETERTTKQLRPALKRPDRVSSSTRQFSIAETSTTGNRPKSHTVDISRVAGSSGHARGQSTVSRANLSRVVSAGHKRRTSTMSGRSIPHFPTDDTSTIQTPGDLDGNGAKPPSLDLDLSFGDVTTMFSSSHYHLILTFQSTVERMKNGRPDKSISSCYAELGPDKKWSVYVDAPTSAVKNVNDTAITSQLPPSALKSFRPSSLRRPKTIGGVDFSSAPLERVKLQLQLQLPSMRDENRKVIKDWWQYAYTAALYEIRQQQNEESTFAGKHLKFDWEKQSYKRKEYVELYIATRLEPSSVLRSMELKVKLGTKSPEEELLKIEDELPVEQILLYRSIARSARVRGMRKMPSSVLMLHSFQWLTGSPSQKKTVLKDTSTLSPPMSPGVESFPSGPGVVEVELVKNLAEVETDCTDINGIRREADALRMHTLKIGDSPQRKTNLKRLLKEDIDGSLAGRMGRATKGSRRFADRVSGGSKGPAKEGNGSIQIDDNSDGRTVRSFKSARTSQTGTTLGAFEKDVSSPGRLRISASISFSNVEVMVYQENTYTGDSADFTRFRPVLTGQSSGVLDSRMRTSAGLQVITSVASSSDMSDVSILSDDQKFFDQHDDTSSMPDAESVGEAPIMSSTDFLMFGLPQNIILRATVSGLEGKTQGQSGGQQIISLSIDGMNVDGDKNSALLSLKPMSTELSHPIDEVHIGKKTKKPGRRPTAVSFAELEMFQEQAVLLSIIAKETGSQVQFDLCKTFVTCNLQAIMKIYEFFFNVQVAFPQPLVAPSKAEDLRRSVLQSLASVKQAVENTNESGVSRAFRLHGLEVGIRGPDGGKEAELSETSGAEAKLSLDLIEYYDGELFEDILMFSNDSAEEYSRKSYEASLVVSDRDWQRRNLNMIDMTKLVEGHHPASPSSSRHAVISVTGIDFSVSTGTAIEGPTCYKLLDAPIDVEMLVTKNYSTDFLSPVPSKQISAEISPVRIILSEARVGVLSSAALSFGGLKDINTESAPESSAVESLPRLAALSIQILVALELRISSMSLTCVDDSTELCPSESIREIIMEESLSDFVSVLSCFNLDYPTKESVEVAGNICVNRLRVLGLSEDEAHDCAHAARLNFLAGMDAMKRSQSELLKELASQEVRGAVASAGEDEGPYASSADNSVPSVAEISDDDSEESLDIIDTTVKGAVEKTISSFSSLLKNSSPVSKALSELLVIHLPTGATLSMTKMFYDFRLECHLKSFHVRNASGTHLLSFHRPCMQQPKVDKDLHSSTAPVASWEEDDDLSAFSFSFFILDSDYNFGEGGLPLAVLGSHEVPNKMVAPQQRQQLTHVVIGQIDILFSRAIVDQAIQSVTSLVASIKSDGVMNDQDAKEKEIQSNLFVAASSFNIVFTSDELVPFCRVEAEECTVDNAVDSSKASAERTCINVAATSLRVLDLTPEGYGYPEILYPLAMNDVASSAPCSSFVLHYFPSSDKWKEPSKLDMELRGMRVVMLLRFLNELMQYMASKDHGAGMLLDKFGFWDAIFDAKGNPPPPFQYDITLIDSSIILPRSSTNIDSLALEVDKITLVNGSAPSSFTMPNATSTLMVPRNVVYKRASDMGLRTHVSSISASSEAEFFDCVDSRDSLDDHDSLTISSFKKGWVKRTTVLLEKFRLLTSLPSDSLSGRPSEDPLIHKFYCLKGRAVNKMPVYTRLHQSFDNFAPSKSGVIEKPSRFWREITASVCSLEIIADKVPNLRLLLSDRPIQRDSSVEIHSLKLDMRLSDLCLVLSVWYSNMQELPVMFPYAPATVEATATATQPSVKVPDYGTDEYVTRLKNTSGLKSEIALVVDALTIRGSFDQSGYFAEDPRSLRLYAPGKGKAGNTAQVGLLPFKVALGDLVLDMSTDKDGITRLACGSSAFEVVDERRAKEFEEVFRVGDQINEPGRDSNSGEGDISQSDQQVPNVERRAWADSSWGLDCNGQTLRGVLPQPFQATVFMTPGWCLTNLGLENADVVVADFSPVGILVDYFASYFSSAAYGNPVFEATKRKEELKCELRGSEVKVATNSKQVSTNTDFRLWLLHPCICVPESLVFLAAPSLSIDSLTGVWYHYRSIETCSLQEVGSTDLSLRFWEEFRQPSICRHRASMERDARALVEGLSFGLRMNVNPENNHTDYVFRMPMFDPRIHDEKAICSVAAPEYDLHPIVLPPPRICIPYVEPTREMGSIVSEVTIFVEVFPTVSSILQNLTHVPEDAQFMDKSGPEPAGEDGSPSVEIAEESSFAALVHIDSFRIFAIDPVLEKHLPVALLCVSPLEANISQLCGTGGGKQVRSGDAYPSDLQVTLKVHIWADYFKLGTTRSWEPFLEPCRCLILCEKSKRRGQGLSLDSDDAFHMNITSSLLLTLDENIRSFSRAISETFGDSKRKTRSYQPSKRSVYLKDGSGAYVNDQILTDDGSALFIRHEVPKPIPKDGRTAFSFRNLTGQKIRIHQLVGNGSSAQSESVVAYLDHNQTTTLSFDATISVIRNLGIVEVPFPGLPNSRRGDQGMSLVDHEVDIQIPGFRWLAGVSVNTSGRKFDTIVPVSPIVLEKVQRDWRLQNAMKIMTEVGVENGGRLIAARSLFDVRNMTSHAIFLNLDPDPTQRPPVRSSDYAGADSGQQLVHPGASFQISSLLVEASLELEGHHLGSFWIRPVDSKDNKDIEYISSQRDDNSVSVVEFSSRPIQLAKLVHESALIFKSNGGEDLEPEKVTSGIQLSCPVIASSAGVTIAPFCYVIEVRRSPLVKSLDFPVSDISPVTTPKQEKSTPQPLKGGKGAERGMVTHFRARGDRSHFVHGPVSYSLLIHPPLVIENLLPKRGRFELMHATRRTVLWFGDLNPGDRIPIHTVGLDAPLLLMVNLGFCRTPVGEGALVHHGSGATNTKGLYNISHGGLKSIGKAVTKGTKQFAKAATAIAESPDKRGQGKMFLVQNPQFSPFRSHSKAKKTFSDVHVEDSPLGTVTGFGTADAKVHGIEHESFDPADVDDETVVVDSVGQRLTLKIDNVRGGGGQRRISLFCPFWIVNTTEHALTYKQEKGSSYVSGTVVSPAKDGSRPVDDSDRNYIVESKLKGDASRGPGHEILPTSHDERRRSGIFAGTPGALASSPGDCPRSPENILSLLDKDLPLQTLTEVAFMFNFQLDMLSVFKLCVQLCDGTGKSRYSSAWSQGFSLDSVGVNQVVSTPCKDGRALEVSMTLSVAPGLLSGYTKIVRFTPRFVLVNYLERPVRIWQDSSLLHPLYEGMDRPTASSDQKRSKWHWKNESDPNDAVNQYEYLFGRTAALDESRIEGITAGTTASKSAMYICTAGTSEVVPFHLPDTRGERQLRIDLGGSWNLSSSFSADATGENTFKISRAVDSRMLCHVTTRASPQYRVVLPPLVDDDIEPWDGELGVWFETDWGGDHRIIVQGIKRESYAFNYTDIRVGDELLRVDDFSVSQMTFPETMKLLKEKLAFMSVDRKSDKPRRRASAIMLRRSKRFNVDDDTGGSSHPSQTKVVLTFRTFEERLRRVRIKALKARGVNATRQDNFAHLDEELAVETEGSEALGSGGEATVAQAQRSSSAAIKVDMRMLHNSAFVVVREPDLGCPPFRIENRAMDHVVFFRQRSCNSYPWNQVLPGESLAYTWEEPLRPRKLIVRVGPSSAIHPIGHRDVHDDGACSNEGEGVGGRLREREKDQTETMKKARSRRLKQLLSAQYVKNEEEGGLGVSVSVKLEVIGFSDVLPCPKVNKAASPTSDSEDYLNCYVDTDGVTRVLIITDKKENEDERTEMRNHIEALQQQIEQEEARQSRIQELRHLVDVEDGRLARTFVEAVSGEESKQEVGSPSHGETAANSPSAAIGTAVNDELQNLAEFPEDISITRCHQVYVEVIEAEGLRSTDASGMCSPYCEVSLKESLKSRKAFLSKGKEKRKTYYIENTTTPKWATQVFIFDISPDAVHATRGYSVRVRLRNFHWVGKHPSLGQTSVYLSSLRQQQELVGWYPLVGTKERSDVDDSLGSYGRGSVKLRLQWIHSIPGLLDYFLLLSERRLTNLRVSADGMKEQLAHAIESEKTREQYVNSLGSFPVPEALSGAVRRRGKMGDGHIRRESREGYEDLPGGIRRNKRLPRPSTVFNFRENLRRSRDMHLSQLDFQTSESKKRRSLSRTKMSGGASEMKSTEDVTRALNTSITGSPERIAGQDVPPGSLAQGDSSTGSDASNGFESSHSISRLGQDVIELSRRGRSFSVPDARQSSHSKVIFRDDIGMINSDVQNFSRLVQGHSFGDASSEGQGSVVFTDDDLWQNQLDGMMDMLVQRGFIHRKEDAGSLYCDHLAYHIRPLLMESSSGNIYRSSVENFRGKSMLRVSPVMREFRSWTIAQAVFNDYELEVDVVGNTFLVKLKDNPISSHNDVSATSCEMTSFRKIESECHEFSAVQPRLPRCMPAAMRERVMKHADELANSRRQFERACRRSLRAVLNPGGWLTIRPMTALYLPETCTGMFVKLRYGPEVVVSETVDAKVSPTWTADTTVQVTPYAHIVTSSGSQDSVFEYASSDLQVYIEPQRTSGSLRLSVIGEKLNKSKVELGVLHIPLGTAINCCVECMEEICEGPGGLAGRGVPAYVRWFPLMNPKDVIAVDGDLGLSSRPLETEQERDDMFIQYFAPCIKLAFIWQPDEEKNDQGSNVQNKTQPAVVVDALPGSPVAETYCNADIGRLSVALIDSQRAVELISFYITDIDIRYSVSKAQTTTGLFLGCIQIDYQGDMVREPVVLAPTPGDNSQPTFQFVAVKDNLRSKSNITSYEYVWFALQEMDLTLEESWVFELWEFFISIVRRLDIRNMSTFDTNVLSTDADRAMDWAALARTTPRGSLVEEHNTEPTLAILLEENESTSGGEKKMYIGQLIMGFVKINLSYLKGKRSWELNERGGLNLRDPDGGLNMAGITIGAGGLLVGRHGGDRLSPTYEKWSERTQDEDLWTDAEIKYSNLPKTIATVFPSVSDAPIRLQGKKIEHVFENPDEIFNSIKGYYQTEILSQIYKIIGALDFVGNPSMVFSSFLTGVRDFFVTPSQAFLRSPHDPSRVGMGVAKGTLSLFSHSASGVFGFISKMSASAGQIVAVLSLDDEFKQWHSDVIVAEAKGLNRQWKRRGVQSVPTMVVRPCYDVIRGIALGLTGVVVNPYVGAKRRGGAGFAKGVAAGTVGIIAKPVVGVLDAFSHASGSVYAMAKSVNVLEKRYQPPKKLRLSYSFGPKAVLMPYDQVAAKSVYLLETHPMKVSSYRAEFIRAMGNEIHVASEVLPMEPGVDTYLVASSHRIVLFQVKKESSGDIASSMRWQVDLTRASSVSCKLQDQGHNGLALIISTTVPKKRVKMARQPSPDRKRGTANLDGPATDEVQGLPQLSLHDTASVHSAFLDRYVDDDEQQTSELLGNKREFEQEDNLHGAMKGKDGETLEWYTIVAEYQHSRQLNRIHNAICCIIGDFDGVLAYRSASYQGSTEGYTSFGELFFGKHPLGDAIVTTPRYDKAVCEDLNVLPWIYSTMFQTLKGKSLEKQQKLLNDMRKSWLLSREVSAALKDGTPAGIVDIRAKSTFVPHAPPPLPSHVEAGDDVVSEILDELKQGNISYDQACGLISSHAKSMAVSYSPESSEVSSVTEGHDVAHDQLFSLDDDNDQPDMDIFRSAKESISNQDGPFHSARQTSGSGRTPSEIKFINGPEGTPSQAPSTPADVQVSRPSFPFLDAMDSSDLHSLAKKSLELQSTAEGSLKSAPLPEADILADMGASTYSLPLDAYRGAQESMIPSWAHGQALRSRTESAPAGLVIPKTPEKAPSPPEVPPTADTLTMHDSWVSQPYNQSRLSRMESMLEHLIMMNARQLEHQDGYRIDGRKEEPEMIALRQEIADLRAQVQEATTDGSRREMIAALRHEVKLLKEELKAEKRKGGNHAAFEASDRDEGVKAPGGIGGLTSEEQLNKVRPAAAKFARGIEKRGSSMANRLRKGTFSSFDVSPSIPEEDEEDKTERDVSSV